jgi:ribosomal protein L40E
MSFGVDTLGGLSEKLKQLINDTQNFYESFIDASQMYKQGKVGDKEFFVKIGDYLVAMSALNFLAVRVILEMKNAMDKGTSIKSPTGGSSYSSSAPQAGFGIGGFVGAGGMVGPSSSATKEPTLTPVDIELPQPQQQTNTKTKNCIICGATIPSKARFCSKCGRSQ